MAEYVALLLASRDVVPIIELHEEFTNQGSKVYCGHLMTTQVHRRLHACARCPSYQSNQVDLPPFP